VGKAPIGGPLFVIAGEADQTVPIEGVRAAYRSNAAYFGSNFSATPFMQ
jgi:pimeloyl-ACP methyl ester carboxylesterase